jgi:prevent-host-death family protein
MSTISQRELRNDNAAIMRAVESGERFTVTRRGVPIARLVPITDDEPELRCTDPAAERIDFVHWPRITSTLSSEELLDELRADR